MTPADRDAAVALANLRHAYAQLRDDGVRHQQEFARGLLGPAIATLERVLAERPTCDWQPIATAPKDGTRVLLCEANGFVTVGYPRVSPGGCRRGWMSIDNERVFATHWQPLPAPPSPLPVLLHLPGPGARRRAAEPKLTARAKS